MVWAGGQCPERCWAWSAFRPHTRSKLTPQHPPSCHPTQREDAFVVGALNTTWKREGGLRARGHAGYPRVLPLPGLQDGTGGLPHGRAVTGISVCRARLLVRGGEWVACSEWNSIRSTCDVWFWDVFPCLLPTQQVSFCPRAARCLVRPLGEALPGSGPQRGSVVRC